MSKFERTIHIVALIGIPYVAYRVFPGLSLLDLVPVGLVFLIAMFSIVDDLLEDVGV